MTSWMYDIRDGRRTHPAEYLAKIKVIGPDSKALRGCVAVDPIQGALCYKYDDYPSPAPGVPPFKVVDRHEIKGCKCDPERCIRKSGVCFPLETIKGDLRIELPKEM